MQAVIDTNVLVRHLTNDPPDQAARATQMLRDADELVLTDVTLAEVVYVLESYYRASREQIAGSIRSILAFEPIRTIDDRLLLRTTELYERLRMDFADAYVAAWAEATQLLAVASFDRDFDRLDTITRLEP